MTYICDRLWFRLIIRLDRIFDTNLGLLSCLTKKNNQKSKRKWIVDDENRKPFEHDWWSREHVAQQADFRWPFKINNLDYWCLCLCFSFSKRNISDLSVEYDEQFAIECRLVTITRSAVLSHNLYHFVIFFFFCDCIHRWSLNTLTSLISTVAPATSMRPSASSLRILSTCNQKCFEQNWILNILFYRNLVLAIHESLERRHRMNPNFLKKKTVIAKNAYSQTTNLQTTT